MKTYKDGLLEAAKVCDDLICNPATYEEVRSENKAFSIAANEIRLLAAQEDQPQEQSADDLLQDALAYPNDPYVLERIRDYLNRKEA